MSKETKTGAVAGYPAAVLHNRGYPIGNRMGDLTAPIVTMHHAAEGIARFQVVRIRLADSIARLVHVERRAMQGGKRLARLKSEFGVQGQ